MWTVDVPQGTYEVWLHWAVPADMAGSPLVVEAGASHLQATIASGSGWDTWLLKKCGTIQLAAGRQEVVVRPERPFKGEFCRLRELWLVPMADRSLSVRVPPRQVPDHRPQVVKAAADGSLVLLPVACEIFAGKRYGPRPVSGPGVAFQP